MLQKVNHSSGLYILLLTYLLIKRCNKSLLGSLMNKRSADSDTTVRRHIFPFEYIQCFSSYPYWLLGNLNLGLKLDGMLYRQILNSGIAVTWSSILLGGRKLKETSVDRK
jgi:hypothetical protein